MAVPAPLLVVEGLLLLLLLLLLVPYPLQTEGQQSYVNNKQLACYESPNTTLGFVCNAAPWCSSFLTFRSTPTYNSAATVAYLLSGDASLIASANNISDVAPLPPDTLLIVPVNCSCSGNGLYYQHNASYSLKTQGETYFSVANNTYQSLSTCQSLLAQNPFDLRNLLPGMKLTVPLRCACPTPAQSSAGFPYLLTYLLRQGDDFNSISAEFAAAGADVHSILDANMLPNPNTLIFFFTPLLVPLKTPPTKQNIAAASPPPPPPPPPTTPSGGSDHKWIFVGVGIGAALLVIFSLIAVGWLLRRRKSPPSPPPHLHRPEEEEEPSAALSQGIRSAMETLTIYKVEELEKATNWFAESNRMDGSASVYRARFKGDEAVVKVMKGDASREIEALRQINHSRVVRLSGFCLHQGTTYLVYEFAHNSSLKQWLAHSNSKSNSDSKTHHSAGLLDWKQRLQIAYDVADALNYLHNFTNPPYIHKNLTTTNILLDANMRAKVANFGLARAVDLDNVMTRHVVGAQGYMAPEYIETGLLTPKLDIFAFGVVMLELLSGRDPVDDHDSSLAKSIGGVLTGENVREKLRGFMDPALGEDYPLELAYSMAQLANTCVAHNLDARPPISELMLALSALRSSSMDWDPSHQEDTSISFSE